MDVHRVLNGRIAPAMRKGDDGLPRRNGSKVEALRDASRKRAAVLDAEQSDHGRRQRWCVLAAANRLKRDVDTLADARTDAAIALASIECDDRVAVASEHGRNGKCANIDPERRVAKTREGKLCHCYCVLPYDAQLLDIDRVHDNTRILHRSKRDQCGSA